MNNNDEQSKELTTQIKLPISENREVIYEYNEEKSRDKMILLSRIIVRDDSKVKRSYFFPSLLTIIFTTALLTYQTIYTYVVL